MRGLSCRECCDEILFRSRRSCKDIDLAGDNWSAASSAQPAAVAVVDSRGDASRDIGDYKLELIYSGDSDGDTE